MEIGVDSFVAATVDPTTGRAIDYARDLGQWLEAIARQNGSGPEEAAAAARHMEELPPKLIRRCPWGILAARLLT